MKSKLILLDSDVVIHLHELGLWAEFTAKYDVYLAETVIEECTFYTNPSNKNSKIPIDCNEYVKQGIIKNVGVEAKDLIALKKTLGSKMETLPDPGEAESLAIVYNHMIVDISICLADHAAIKCAVLLDMEESCVSLEAALKNCQINITLKKQQYSEKWLRDIMKAASVQKVQQMFGN
jgi:hypothetical protein